jgi:Relaxase/Mobilisation nuclease domain
MIIRILSHGKSFSGAATYLTHDPQADTSKRVGWTHTINLANDHVPSAVNEMVWTARDAELLKQEAGVRAGGRATEDPVKHLSLNWSPEDDPSREHMIQATEEFLRHMKWQEHQALVVAHTDKSYAHVHVLLNVIHPDTGLRLDDNFERVRAQKWAADYEREQGRIHCEQRLLSPEQREDGPPRHIWLAFKDDQQKFERDEKNMRGQEPISGDDPRNYQNAEWKKLKEIQRGERIEFFAAGKIEFKEMRLSIYREIREEFRERWSDYYSASRKCDDPDLLAGVKAQLLAEQKEALDARRDEACKELRAVRDERYRSLLDNQRDIRADLTNRQEAGLDSTKFLENLAGRSSQQDVRTAFRDASAEITETRGDNRWDGAFRALEPGADEDTVAGNGHVGRGAGSVGVGAFKLFDSVLSIFEGTRPNPGPSPADQRLLQAAADEALKQQQQRDRDDADAEWRKRQRSPYGE